MIPLLMIICGIALISGGVIYHLIDKAPPVLPKQMNVSTSQKPETPPSSVEIERGGEDHSKQESPNIEATLITDGLNEKYVNFHIRLNNANNSPPVNNLIGSIKTPDSHGKEFISPTLIILQPGREFILEPPSFFMVAEKDNRVLLTLSYSIATEGAQWEYNSIYRFAFNIKQVEKGNIINSEAVDHKKVKKLEGKEKSLATGLPGISLQMYIRLINHFVDRRKYLIDLGHVDGPRFSAYLSPDDIFTLLFIDNKKEPHPVQIPVGLNGVPSGIFFHLSCEVGVSDDTTILRISIDGEEIRRLNLPFKTDIGKLALPGGVIGADINGENGAWFDCSDVIVLSATMSPQQMTGLKGLLETRPHNVYIEYRGNQWMKAQRIGPSDFVQEDKQHQPIFRDEHK